MQTYRLAADHRVLTVDLVDGEARSVFAVLAHIRELPGEGRRVADQHDSGSGIGGMRGCLKSRQRNDTS
ncbi:hypothetical protein PPGU19_074770 (plasmid) [Paraburkholderia sp. PGU19]|nr:hypothetical protein PPGU19_074770 [Paraburkholderia sp. PGU19]